MALRGPCTNLVSWGFAVPMLDLYLSNRKQAEQYRHSLLADLQKQVVPETFPAFDNDDPQPFYLEFKKQIGERIKEETDSQKAELNQSENCHLLLLKHTALVDTVIQVAFQTALWLLNQQRETLLKDSDVPVAVVARGSYGREEMFFHSDVDLQVVVRNYEEGPEKELAYQLVHYFDYLFVYQEMFSTSSSTGHSQVDTKGQELDEENLATFHSLLEHRFVAGNPAVYSEFTNSIQTASRIHKERIVKYCSQYKHYFEVQNTVFQQEPNVKEELRRLYWALNLVRLRGSYTTINQFELLAELFEKEVLSSQAFKSMHNALSFLTRIRLFLHCQQSGSHKDILSYEVREFVAEKMGYAHRVRAFFDHYFFNAVLPMKRFSRNLFWESMTFVKGKSRRLSPHFALNSEDQIVFAEGETPHQWESPLEILEIFTWMSRKNYLLSYPVIRSIEQHTDQMLPMFMDPAHRSRVQEYFHNIIKGKYFAKALRYLHEFKLLENHFIPEFKNLTGLLQDIYVHMFPTDIHVLAALDELNKLETDPESDPFLVELFQSLKDKSTMKLSVLLHDIGKGLKAKGENEELVGSRAIPRIMENLGYGKSKKMIEDIAFLVEKHLMMRDLMLLDPDDDTTYEMIWDLVNKNVERLKMLILLTFADRAGTKMRMSKSQIDQLKYFYQNTLHHKKQQSVSQPVKQEFLKMIRLPRELESQLQIYNEFKKSRDGFASEILFKSEQPSELVVCTRNQSGLLYKISAVLAFNQLNIVEANIHTLDDNVFDVFKVVTGTGEPIDFSNFFFFQKQVLDDLKKIFVGGLDVSSLYRGRALHSGSETKMGNDLKLKIALIGRTVKVETHDVIGTTMMEAKVFSEQGMEIDRAVIHSNHETASNIFYVRPEDVRTIMQEEEKFKSLLIKALSPLFDPEPIFPDNPAEVA